MNRIISLLLAMFVTNVLCAQKDSHDLMPATKLIGKWIEFERLKGKGSMSFEDTMQLEINNKAYAMVRFKMSKSFSGDAKQDGDKLFINDMEYKVKVHNSDELWLQDDRLIHRLKLVKQFEDSPIPKSIGVTKEVQPLRVDLAHLVGNWFCYKKFDSNFSSEVYYLRDLKIVMTDKASANVKIKTANMAEALIIDGTMKLNKNVMEITTLSSTVEYGISSYDKSELVLREGSKTYFLKRIASSNE